MIAVTGATGQLGRLVIEALQARGETPIALARRPEAAADLGVPVRAFDYDAPETLAPALEGVSKLLLISGSEVGKRAPQHKAVIAAAKAAGVGLIAYTSILKADVSPLGLAVEHRATEAALAESGLPFVLLRNGWYAENLAAGIAPALAHGAVIGAAGAGRLSVAARADYAEAAAAVLTSAAPQAGKVHELGGDDALTLADFAAILAAESGRPVAYVNMTEAELAAALKGAGLPEGLAGMLADSDAGAAQGGLEAPGRDLSALIGRPTTPLSAVVKAALETAPA